MALPFAALTGGDSILVRHLKPLSWGNARTPRRLVRHLVDSLSNQQGTGSKGMNKVIQTDFLLRGTNVDFSWPRLIGDSGWKERRRILIVDSDPNTTHL